jgi:hypothetical protein
MNGGNLEKIYVIETKSISSFPAGGWKKTRGEKMKVSSIMLLKTHGEKMSETGLSIMLLKIRLLQSALHYVIEKNMVTGIRGGQWRAASGSKRQSRKREEREACLGAINRAAHTPSLRLSAV